MSFKIEDKNWSYTEFQISNIKDIEKSLLITDLLKLQKIYTN